MASRRKRVAEVIPETVIDTVPEGYIPEETPPPEKVYSDLHIICEKCEADQLIGEGIEGNGLQLVIGWEEKSFIQLNCTKCGACLKLKLVPGKAPEIKVEEPINEDIPQENKPEESL